MAKQIKTGGGGLTRVYAQKDGVDFPNHSKTARGNKSEKENIVRTGRRGVGVV